jgi:alkylation response protein AidB-like acyl-CoA dehydrogenase
MLGRLDLRDYVDRTDPTGVDAVAWSALFEEMGSSALGVHLLAGVALAAPLLHVSGSADGQAVLDRVLAAETSVALAIQEPGDNWTRGEFDTVATDTPSGVRISGRKCRIVSPPGVDQIVVACRYGSRPALFLVPPANAPMVEDAELGQPFVSFDLRLDGAEATWISGEALSETQVRWALDVARLALASLCVGGTGEALRLAIDYVGERRTYGTLLQDHQIIAHRCADMYTTAERARAITAVAALDLQQGTSLERSHSVSAALIAAARAYVAVATETAGVFGGIGSMAESQSSVHYRRAHWCASLLGAEREHARLLDMFASVGT